MSWASCIVVSDSEPCGFAFFPHDLVALGASKNFFDLGEVVSGRDGRTRWGQAASDSVQPHHLPRRTRRQRSAEVGSSILDYPSTRLLHPLARDAKSSSHRCATNAPIDLQHPAM